MQFTPQQLAGYKGYSKGVLIGNWNEDLAVETDKMKLYKHALEGTSASNAGQQSNDFVNVANMTQKVSLFPAQDDGFVHFAVPLQVRSIACDAVLAVDTTARNRPRVNQALATATADKSPAARSAWFLQRLPGDANLSFYNAQKEGDVLHYGQSFRLSNEYASGDGFYSIAASLQNLSKSAGKGFLEVSASLGTGADSIFVVEPAGSKAGSQDGNPVKLSDQVVLVHRSSNSPLACQPSHRRASALGSEFDLAIGTVKTMATKAQAAIATQPENYFTFIVGARGAAFTPYTAPVVHSDALARIRAKILERGQSEGFRGIVRVLRTMDTDDKNCQLTRVEFKAGLDRYGVQITTSELDSVFKVFDRDGNGVVTLTEFLREIRGEMNARRRDIVEQAFRKIDLDGSGVVTLKELTSRYRSNIAKVLPDASSKDQEQAVRIFSESFGGRGGNITFAQFCEYYNDIGAAIDEDDYFELVVRNAWHIAGGNGVTENTSNKRVLVVFQDGTQKVIGLDDDLGLDGNSIPQIRQRLEQQGVRNIKEIKTSM